MADYIERANLLDGISSPEFGLDEIIDELIYKHNLDFLHDNNEDAVREFAKDLIGSIKNYIKTEPTADVEEVKHGEWKQGIPYVCSICGKPAPEEKNTGERYSCWVSPYCSHCGAQMDLSEKPTGCERSDTE